MGFFTRLLQPEKRSLNDIPELKGWLFADKTASGVDVTPESALSMLAVFACIRVLSEALAQLPLILYRRLPNGGKERATDDPLYTLLHDLPNGEMTSFSFRETLMGHLCGWGNGYAEIEFNRAGDVAGLWPLRPDQMKVERNGTGMVYTYDRKPIPAYKIFHVPGLGFDGRVGYSPIAIARQAIGLGLAAEEFSARFFANDGRPGIVIEHPGHLGDLAFDNLQKSWKDEHGGVANAHHPAILEEGMKIHEIGLPGEDVQFLSTRKFQREEIAGLFRVPPHLIADLERATFSNIEQQSLEFVIYTLTPWLVQWEQTITWKLIPRERRREMFAEFLVDGLLRGDAQSRYAAYSSGRQNGWLSANDVREKENMNPIEGGDVYLIPMNMMPANDTGQSSPGGVPSTARQGLPQVEQALSPGPSPEIGRGELEERSAKSARSRNRLGHAYKRMYADVMGRVIRREQADIRKAATRYLGQRDVMMFNSWLDQFYREHRPFVKKNVTPLYHSFGDAIAQLAQDEVNATEQDMTRELERFTATYVDDFGDRHSDISYNRMRGAVQQALDSGENPADAVEVELGKWDERPDDTAMWESVRFGNAIAVTVFGLAGREFLRWHAFGDSCPYCKSLNGKKAGIREFFLEIGDFQPEGADKPLTLSNNVRHPPAHGGCDCGISAA